MEPPAEPELVEGTRSARGESGAPAAAELSGARGPGRGSSLFGLWIPIVPEAKAKTQLRRIDGGRR